MTNALERTNRRFPPWRSLVIALVLSGSALGSRSSAQVFRSTVTVGVLDVIVTDAQGRSVTDLTKSDFEVTDEGAPREIVSVSFVSIPIAPPRVSPPAASDVFTNTADSAGRRIFAIVLDDLNTSPMDTPRARAAVKTIVEALPDGDLVALVLTGQQAGAQEFTSDKGRLLESMNRFVGRRSMPIESDDLSLSEREKRGNMAKTPVEGTEDRLVNFIRALDTLRNVATWLATIEGRRKAVLYVTAGLPANLAQAFADTRSANADFRSLVTAAMRANVAIYPVDARGLAAPDDTDSSAAGLWALANDTGGIATINTNDLARAVDVAVRDSSAYYMVGYSLPPAKVGQKPDLRPRRVRVRALRPGLTVRARQLSAGGLPPQERVVTTAALVASPLPGGRIPVSLHAASFAAPGGKARAFVTVEVGGDAIQFSERAGKMFASLQYRIVATDVSGKVAAGESNKLEFKVSAARRDQMRESRTRLVASLALPPGAYRIRAAVLDGDHGEHGVVAGDLDVVRYDKGVTLSTVEIASVVEGRTPTMRANVVLFDSRLSSPPTTQRTFGRADTIDAFAEAYAAKAAGDQVRATVTVSREGGGVISERPLTLTREKGIGGVQCYAIRTRVPLKDLEPASYRLKISLQASGSSVERSIAFTVR